MILTDAQVAHQTKYKAELKRNIEFLNEFTVGSLKNCCIESGYPTRGNKAVLVSVIARKWTNRDVPPLPAAGSAYYAEAASNA